MSTNIVILRNFSESEFTFYEAEMRGILKLGYTSKGRGRNGKR